MPTKPNAPLQLTIKNFDTMRSFQVAIEDQAKSVQLTYNMKTFSLDRNQEKIIEITGVGTDKLEPFAPVVLLVNLIEVESGKTVNEAMVSISR